MRGLKNDLETVKRIAKAGQEMVLANHTSDIRAQFVIDKVFGVFLLQKFQLHRLRRFSLLPYYV